MKIIHKEYTPTQEVIIPFCEMEEGEKGIVVQWHCTDRMTGTEVYVKDGRYHAPDFNEVGRVGWTKNYINTPIQIKELLIKVRRRL